MTAGVTSLRVWLLAAMVASAVIGLGGAGIIYGRIQRGHERAADTAKARSEVQAIARQIQAGAGLKRIAALQTLLTSDQVVVRRDGRTVFTGPAHPGQTFELRVQAPITGGVVTLTDFSSPSTGTTPELLLVTAAVIALVIAAAVATATLVTRAVRAPVSRAIAVAEQVSHGEFAARMGASGPDELVKLGRAFDGMASRLERADRDQRRFLADVAHEIATPVNSISGFALALADGTSDGPEQRAEARTMIETETRRLRELLKDLRELTSLDFAEGVRRTRIDTGAFARELTARFAPAAERAGIRLTRRVRAREVATDVRLLEMVVSNLLSNAIRYTPAGGDVTLSIRRQRDRLIFAVTDTGVGIAPEHRDRIFERLYRIDDTRDRATGGSGLGLAIAVRAARSLGGHIELDSTLGQGSEFRFVLPAGDGTGSAARPAGTDGQA
ncbi:MAG TPA: HAMP domain-containing sensor histidine kinase [Solirubrobacteraceae bacterium]|nr:HAMP domain-containing sensor histidine kinase [Solirubrobacteraceae bacterium]